MLFCFSDSHSSKLVDRIFDDGDTFAVGDPAFKVGRMIEW